MKKILYLIPLLALTLVIMGCTMPQSESQDEYTSQEEATPEISQEEQDMVADLIAEDVALHPTSVEVHGFDGEILTIYPEYSDWHTTDSDHRLVTDPETGYMYFEMDDGEFYPEGTDHISQEEQDKISELIEGLE